MHIGHLLSTDTALREAALRLPKEPEAPFPILMCKIKLTWRCNLRCSMCALWRCDHRKSGAELAPEAVKNALQHLSAQGLKKVHFSGGEVLLYPHLKEVLQFARGLNLQVNLTTNGTLLNKEWARFFVEHRVHSVALSVDSHNPKVHDTVRAKKGAFKATMKGIRLLADRRHKKGRGPKIAVNTVVSRENAETIPEMYDFLKDLPVDSWRLLPLDSQDKTQLATKEQWEGLARAWSQWGPLLARAPIDWTSERSAERAQKGKYAGVFYPKHRCYAPWFNLFMDADGKVYPCCMGKAEMQPFGELSTSEFNELLVAPARRELQYSFAANHMFPVCERCDDFLEENMAFHQLHTQQPDDSHNPPPPPDTKEPQ